MMASNEILLHHRRHRSVVHSLVKHVFELGITTCYRVADNNYVGTLRKILGPIAFKHWDRQPLKLERHWRINVLIRAGDLVSLSDQHTGKRGHSSATHANQVIMFRVQTNPSNQIAPV